MDSAKSLASINTSIRAFSTSTCRRDSLPNKPELDANYIFRFADEQDAREDRYARIPQELPLGEVDDLEECQRNKRAWVLKIMDAIQNTSPMTDMLPVEDSKHVLVSHELCIKQIKSRTKNPMQPHELERCAWLLLDEVWRLHRVGFCAVKYHVGIAHLRNASWGTAVRSKCFIPPLKCSQRLEAIVKAIKDIPFVARDVTRGANLVELASSPHLVVAGKLYSFRANACKRAKDRA
ncbi:hypothetical protein AC578_3999 [Pseudocercospora eumusae]|uniref:Uncharacterized protein n=1 Tax=Pseudocercospora eumusae TaxID=321146 RepID=A0A139HLD0_9PEZI|nr:hypothetical protein AC578_3999 [Pseudocercospora eumusae]